MYIHTALQAMAGEQGWGALSRDTLALSFLLVFLASCMCVGYVGWGVPVSRFHSPSFLVGCMCTFMSFFTKLASRA